MTPAELLARAYCQSIGANPDEIVWGHRNSPARTHGQRWRFYARKQGVEA